MTTVFLVLIVVSLGTAVLVLARNHWSRINRTFAIFLIATVVTLIGFLLLFATQHFIFDKFIHYGGLVIIASLFTFAQIFPGNFSVPRWRLVFYAPFLVVAALIPYNLLIKEMVVDAMGVPRPVNGPLLSYYALMWGVYFFASIYFLIRTYRKVTGRERMQMKYVLLGLGAFCAGLFFFALLLPVLGVSELSLIGPLCSVVFIIATAYAILRHQLLDIRVVIQRGLIYTILLALIMGFYIGLFQTVGWMLHEVTSLGNILSAGIVMFIGIFFARPLETYFRKITDPIFFKDRYDYAFALRDLSHVLYTSLDEGEIVKHSEESLRRIFKTKHAALVLDSGTEPIRSSGTSNQSSILEVPISFENSSLGVIRLGEKRSGDVYTDEDLALVSTFAFSLAVAIGKARLHETVREYNLHLEDLVAERTREIKELQEHQKESMLEISHNLQTPLAIMQTKIESMEEQAAHAGDIAVVRQSIERVSYFIRQMLHLARLESALYPIQAEELSLTELVRDQIEYFQVMGQQEGVSVRGYLKEQISFRADKKLIEEMLTNLVVNAITYRRPHVQGVIDISLRSEGTSVLLTVSDNGIGIAREHLADIFKRFYRVGTSGKKGTGLGLAIVKEIVERHGGTISVQSTLGKGTCFTIRFPKSLT